MCSAIAASSAFFCSLALAATAAVWAARSLSAVVSTCRGFRPRERRTLKKTKIFRNGVVAYWELSDKISIQHKPQSSVIRAASMRLEDDSSEV